MAQTTADANVLNATEEAMKVIANSPTVDYTGYVKRVGGAARGMGDATLNLGVKIHNEQKRKEHEENIRIAKEKKQKVDEFDRALKSYGKQIKTLPDNEDEWNYYKKQSELFASTDDDQTHIKLINDLNDRASKLNDVSIFLDSVVASGKKDNPAGLTDNFKAYDPRAKDLAGILDGTIDNVFEDGNYVWQVHDPELEKQNKNEIQTLKTQLSDLDEKYEFGGIEEFDYLDEQELMYNQIFELEQDITKGSKRSYGIEELTDLIEEQSFDLDSATDLSTYAFGKQEEASAIAMGGNLDMNEKIVEQWVRSWLDGGKERSITEDDILQNGGSFKQGMMEAVQTLEYQKDLGIDPTLVQALDPNGGKVEEGDAEIIVERLLEDPEMAYNYKLAYYTNFIRTAWNDGVKSRDFGNSSSGNTGEWTEGPV